MAVHLRDLAPSDLPAVEALNDAAVPAVNRLDRDALGALAADATIAVVAETDDRIGGFVIALGPGLDYGSPNYRWFAARYDDFVYVDRVVVDAACRGTGIGSRLYGEVERRATAPWFVCEVNLRPPNAGSLAFHERHGFREVGQQDTEGGAKRVVLLARPLG